MTETKSETKLWLTIKDAFYSMDILVKDSYFHDYELAHSRKTICSS